MDNLDGSLFILFKTLYRRSKTGDWGVFVEAYEENLMFRQSRMNYLGDTPLHFAIINGAPGYIVEKLVNIASEGPQIFEEEHILEMVDYQGNTPLHLAVSKGSLKSCVCIAEARPPLLASRNKEGVTPLYLAAARATASIEIFLCLRYIGCSSFVLDEGISSFRNQRGETVLHYAIKTRSWEFAYRILKLHPELHDSVDVHGNQPLHLLAMAPSAFTSGSQLGFFNGIIYGLTPVDVNHEPELDPAKLIDRCNDRKFDEKTIEKIPKKYKTCFDFFKLPWTMCITKEEVNDKGPKPDEENPNAGSQGGGEKAQKKHLLSRIYSACFRSESIRTMKQKHVFCTRMMRILVRHQENKWHFDGGINPRLKAFMQEKIGYDEDRERTYCPGDLFDEDPNFPRVREIHQHDDDSYLGIQKGSCHPTDQKDKKERNNRSVEEKIKIPHLMAAKNGNVKFIEFILKCIPSAMSDVDSEGKNIVLLTVEHRQTELFSFLQSYLKDRSSSFSEVDFRGNNALHLAAKLPDSNPWPVPGAASQMQWEVRWYEKFHYSLNNDGESPEEILSNTHEALIVERRDWLSYTSNACSVVAGLLVTVTYPMSTTMPGGMGDNGSPYLLNQSTFSIFAISSYVSFYSSLIAVVLFLSVLTSAYSKSGGFHHDLPSKLLLGLTAFYVSIASTAISFSAGHYFILKDKLKSAAFPAYAGVCLLVIFFSIIEFPLYFQLAWATFKKVPQRRKRLGDVGHEGH
nr:nf-kappa-b inhibitor alpha [Quercus suber]